MPETVAFVDILRGILYGFIVFALIAAIARLLTRRHPWTQLANSLYFLAFTAGVAVFLRVNPALKRPPVGSYYQALILFAFVYLAVKLGDLLYVDFFIAKRRKFLPPSILRELICFGLYFVAILFIMATVLHINLMPLLATSAVLSLVAGLALQETLSNFFAGVTLATERPFKPGDWVQVGQRVGQVVEMGWRAVKIELYEEEDHLIVPNSVLAKEQVVNFSQPDPLNGQEVYVGVHYRHPPSQVIAALQEAAQGVEGVVARPAPFAGVIKYGDSSIEYRLHYWIADFEASRAIRAAILSNIWYAFKRRAIEIPFPIRTVQLHTLTEEAQRAAEVRRVDERLALLREVDFLNPLTSEELTRVANSMQPLPFEAGRTVVRQGDEGDTFFLVSRGRVGVWVSDGRGDGQQVATMGRGQCFGEMSLLTGARRTATVRTLEDAELLVLGKAEFRDILLANPKVAESLSLILTLRQKDYESALARERSTAYQLREQDPAGQLLMRIKLFLGL
jgi:small-conductance mechanosensitive channel/CRP-like cAMP-binding protein